MEQKIKLTGCNNLIDYSADAKYIIISGYDGGFKVFDTVQNKLYCKTKVKDSANDIIIHNQGISFDNKYAAFSALRKVLVMDIAKKEIIWEYTYSKAERMMTIPFFFFNQSSRLIIPDGDRLLIYDIEQVESHRIGLPDGAGFTDCVAVNPNDTQVAYKSCNGSWDLRLDREGNILSYTNEYKEDMSDRVFIYDIVTGKCTKEIYILDPQIQAKQNSISGIMKFVDDETLLINRNSIGFSYFNIKTGKEIRTINWKDKGFEFGKFSKAKIYAKDRFILFNNVTPDPKSIQYDENGSILSYSCPIPDGLEYILFDTKEDKVIFRHKNGEPPTAFHPETKLFAYIKREWDEKYKRTEYLCICKFLY